MKSRLLLLAFALLSQCIQAQTDLSINPVSMFYKYYVGDCEIGLSPNFSIDIQGTAYSNDQYASGIFNWEEGSFVSAKLMAKYYFQDREVKLTNLWFGAYLIFNSKLIDKAQAEIMNRQGLGFSFGYKWMSSKRIFFEFTTGLGRYWHISPNSDLSFIDSDGSPFRSINGFLGVRFGYRFVE